MKQIKAHNVGFLAENWNISLIPEKFGNIDEPDFKIEDISWDVIKGGILPDEISINIRFMDLKTRHIYMLEADVEVYSHFDEDYYGNKGINYQGMDVNDSSVSVYSYADGYSEPEDQPTYEGDETKIIDYAIENRILPSVERSLRDE